MNTHLKKIFSALLTLLPLGVLLIPHAAHAACIPSLYESFDFSDCMFSLLGWIANMAMTAAAWYLSVCGLLLNGAMTATLNIKDLVAGSGGVIGATWTTLRDLSSIAIIFMLLWSSISIIIDIRGPKFNELIKNIFLVGLLINFSLFFTNIAVDASNLISLSFYRAITPAYSSSGISEINWRSAMDGGISNVFMQSLQIQKIYEPSKQLKGSNPKLNIIIAGIGGTILMIVAGTSFVFAAFAFLIRLGIILLLMVFSPVYFIGWIVPEVSKFSKMWWDQLRAQCLFMPVYLAFLYVAMRIISAPGFMNFLNPSRQSTDSGAFSNLPYLGGTIGVILQYVIAFLMINIPLIAASDIGGKSVEWGKKFSEKFNEWTGSAAKSTGGFVGRNTLGWGAQKIDDKLDKTRAGSTRIGQAVRSFTTGAAAGATYGGKTSYKQAKKAWDDRGKEVDAKHEENERRNVFNRLSGVTYIDSSTTTSAYKAAIKEMKEKERVDLGKDNLMNIEVLKHLKDSDFEAIKKSGKYSESEIKEITAKRYEALAHASKNNQTEELKFMVKNMNAKDLVSDDAKKLISSNKNIMDCLTANQLKDMQPELSPDQRKAIAEYILSKPGVHSAYGNMDKNKASWGITP